MKEEWTLIEDNGRQRFYRLNFIASKFPGSFSTIDEILETGHEYLNEMYSIAEDCSGGFNKVCISDSMMHAERLVFPVVTIKNKNDGTERLLVIPDEIDGIMTSLIDGGDCRSIYRDETYLHRLRLANK